MNKELDYKKSLEKPHKGRVFRNIWLISIAVFATSIIGMFVSVIADKSAVPLGLSISILILIASVTVGSLSFMLWIFKIGNKLIKTVILIPVGLFILLILVASAMRYAIVDGNSMEPSFKNNEVFLVNKLSYKTVTPKRGEVVSYTLGKDFGEYMGRIVGLPDETVVILKGEVGVNGNKLDEPYANWADWLDSDKVEISLKSEEYLILLDKRTKKINVVNKQNIIGKFTYKLW